MTATPCPCGSGAILADCCGPVIAGAPAATAEALMRSRYTAFVQSNIAHIRATYATEHRAVISDDLPAIDWVGLEIMGTSGGAPDDNTGTVDFAARYGCTGKNRTFAEKTDAGSMSTAWLHPSYRQERPVATIRVRAGRGFPFPSVA